MKRIESKYLIAYLILHIITLLVLLHLDWVNKNLLALVLFEGSFLISVWLTFPHRKIFDPQSLNDWDVPVKQMIIWMGLSWISLKVFIDIIMMLELIQVIVVHLVFSLIILFFRKILNIRKNNLSRQGSAFLVSQKKEREKLSYELSTKVSIQKIVQYNSINNFKGKNVDELDLTGSYKKSSILSVLPKRIDSYLNIDKELAQRYQTLDNGGVILLRAKIGDKVENKILNISFKPISWLIYLVYFFFFRVLPKTPIINKLLLLISLGKWRSISKTETWGRLAFAGFDVINEIELQNGEDLIVARKLYTPFEQSIPSFYPIISLNRVGYLGETIRIFKLRSMYPYSEFLQQKIYEMNSLDNTGKFKDDFRITRYGKYVRKFWLDELPQVINWLRGDIKIVGIRAMSFQYFSLYPQWYKDLYYSVKPGFVSPIFDDNTTSFDDIVEIEGNYLKRFIKNKIKTDISFFFETAFQILGGVRSK